MPDVQHKRGTRAALDALAAANGLKTGQIYLITDEGRIAVATGMGAYVAYAKQSEAGGGGSDPWTTLKQGSDLSNSAVTTIESGDLVFNPSPNKTYEIEAKLMFTSAANATGVQMGLTFPTASGATGACRVQIGSGGAADTLVHNASSLSNTTVKVGAINAVGNSAPFFGRIDCIYKAPAAIGSGGIRLVFNSEVAGSAVTLIAGSILRHREL
ncbi:hypothetical protein [Allosphingosinicella indica]|uniref:Uncharacterized protein n=1 Tax=Allosphingosinicella indica TaxID=941907 RepID=A0A1X7GJ44_9SPHN|nr:hypothetical protein [Allosphingosinicella indica]SMF70480.1 hypothetical protein SAMN06295910_1876 [Allosphingosinicella indica]